MNPVLQRRALVAVCSLLFLVLFTAVVSGGVSALILTTTGETATGNLTGISPVIRLNVPLRATNAGLRQAFDIPLATIRQISIDFPRVIIETSTRVYVGPFSAFSGISELLTLHQEELSRSFPTASLRAIALHGEPIQQVPREWVGDRFRRLPPLLVTPFPNGDEPPAMVVVEPRIEPEPVQIWDDLHPMIPPPEEEQDLWWVSMLVVAGVAVLLFLIFNGR